MLVSLGIRDVVLVERLDLAFAAGLSVLTGETGAGKSILLDALGLALGGRADVGLIRRGASQAVVIAEFDLPADHPARTLLTDQGLEAEGSLVLRRIVGGDGRSRAAVNDQAVSVGLLRQVGRELVEIHGQFDQQGLMDPDSHRDLLDLFGGLNGDRMACGAAYKAWRTAEGALAQALEQHAKAAAQAEWLRHSVDELDRMRPDPGESEALSDRRTLMQQQARLLDALSSAMQELTGDRGAEAKLAAAQRVLSRLPAEAGKLVDPALAAIDRAANELAEAADHLRALGRDQEGDGRSLDQLEERLFALRALARKHDVTPEALPALHRRLAESLAAISDGASALERLRAASAAARTAYLAAATTLSTARREAASRLDPAVMAEFPPLKLDKARLVTRIDTLPESGWAAHGTDRVAFEIATNPGAEPGPIGKIASGGELARLMLALKVVLARGTAVPTLIFDEVDSGMGGAVAAAVGDRMARLGEGLQVLAVTHSPQVAARAAQHFRVAKQGDGSGVTTRVDLLPAAVRREEIARMLSGAEITAEARAAADRLLAC